MENEKKNFNRDSHRGRDGERTSYGEHRNFSRDGERKSYGEKKTYGGHKSYGEKKSYGEHKPYGEHKASGDHKPYGEHKSYGEHKPYGERKSYGEHKPYGDRKQYGEHKSYGERRQDGEQRPYGERRQYGRSGRPNGGRRPNQGGGRPYAKREPYFTDRDEQGIDRMLSRKPRVDESRLSDNDTVTTGFQEVVRLNRFIANSGVCSRREADTYIQAGVITVNGEVVTELGTKVNVLNDEVKFNGERLKGEEKVYIVMNKPKGYVTTASDPHAEKTVMELLKGCSSRVFPVGRLDKATTGVLMFTNDGEIAEKLTHPSYNKKKIYQVSLDHNLTQEDYEAILAGVTLNDGEVAADELEFIDENDHRKLGIEIHSGKNRIVRRIFESLGYDVKALDRVYFAGLTKKGLQKGEWRYLTEGEVNILKMGAYA